MDQSFEWKLDIRFTQPFSFLQTKRKKVSWFCLGWCFFPWNRNVTTHFQISFFVGKSLCICSWISIRKLRHDISNLCWICPYVPYRGTQHAISVMRSLKLIDWVGFSSQETYHTFCTRSFDCWNILWRAFLKISNILRLNEQTVIDLLTKLQHPLHHIVGAGVDG